MNEQSESYRSIFFRFLRFGFLAWGGPVAQVAMLKQELVTEEKWITPERFNKVFAVYQVLPGPEATELCIFFGMQKTDRLGGFLAGFAFVLPGFLLMLGLSWLYATFGLTSALFAAVFLAIQPAVAALIVRAVHRIGSHTLKNRWAWGIAGVSFLAELLGVPFWVTLPLGALVYSFALSKKYVLAAVAAALLVAAIFTTPNVGAKVPTRTEPNSQAPTLSLLFESGLKAGFLTFGGAYTAIPFVREDAVERGRWISNTQFLDGLALSGILPAPLIIFSTFVGYIGGGAIGAVLITIGIFLPAFLFTLLGHDLLEKIIENPKMHGFLDGVTAGVLGLISATTVEILPLAIASLSGILIFLAALTALYVWKAKTTALWVITSAGVVGLFFYYVPRVI